MIGKLVKSVSLVHVRAKRCAKTALTDACVRKQIHIREESLSRRSQRCFSLWRNPNIYQNLPESGAAWAEYFSSYWIFLAMTGRSEGCPSFWQTTWVRTSSCCGITSLCRISTVCSYLNGLILENCIIHICMLRHNGALCCHCGEKNHSSSSCRVAVKSDGTFSFIFSLHHL